MGSCLYTLSHTHMNSGANHRCPMWCGAANPPTPPYYLLSHQSVLLPGLFFKCYATLHWNVLLFPLDLLNLSQILGSFGWIFFPCGVVLCVLGSRHALYSIKSGVVAPLGWGGARYLSQHTRHPPELSKGLFKPLNQGHAGQEHTSTDKHTLILTYWACYRARTLKSAK